MTLSPRQHSILSLLARGFDYLQIRQRLGINASTLHTHVHNLRLKTGMAKRNREAAQSILDQIAPLPPITPTQKQVLHLLSTWHSHEQICAKLGISLGTSYNHASRGATRLGIPNTLPHTARMKAIATALQALNAGQKPMDDSMF